VEKHIYKLLVILNILKRRSRIYITLLGGILIALVVGSSSVILYQWCLIRLYDYRNQVKQSLVIPAPLQDPAIEKQLAERRHLDEMDPPGIAHIPEYATRGLDGRHIWNTNVAELWDGIWKQNADGWRVQLKFFNTNSPEMCVVVRVGSITKNSGLGYVPPPDRKFLKFELMDTNGNALQYRWRAAARDYEMRYGKGVACPRPWLSLLDTSLEEAFPATISGDLYPRFKDGTWVDYVGFLSNGPPCQIGYVKFKDNFLIKTEGDYILTVRPVLYKMRGGTNENILNRVDLPTVTAKVHLMPP